VADDLVADGDEKRPVGADHQLPGIGPPRGFGRPAGSAGDRRGDAVGRDPPDGSRLGDVQVAGTVDGEPRRSVEAAAHRCRAVPEGERPTAGDRGDQSLAVHLADQLPVGEVEVARAVDDDPVGADGGPGGRTAVAPHPFGSSPGDGGDDAGRADLANPPVPGVDDEQVLLAVDGDARGVVQARRGRQAAVAVEAGPAPGSGHHPLVARGEVDGPDDAEPVVGGVQGRP